MFGIRKSLCKIIGIRRCASFEDGADPVVRWLKAKGITDPRIIHGIKDAFGGHPSINDLSSLGDRGLLSVAEAVDRDVATRGCDKTITVHVTVPGGKHTFPVTAHVGHSFFDLAQTNREVSRYMECTCQGIAACSTCHVYVDPKFLDKLPLPDEAEADMLDLAWGFKENSRLGCQIKFTEEIDGLEVYLPEKVNDLFK